MRNADKSDYGYSSHNVNLYTKDFCNIWCNAFFFHLMAQSTMKRQKLTHRQQTPVVCLCLNTPYPAVFEAQTEDNVCCMQKQYRMKWSVENAANRVWKS